MTIARYSDAALTTLHVAPIVARDPIGASPGDGVIWLGDPSAAYVYRASSDPGVDPIEVAIAYVHPTWTASTSYVIGDLVLPSAPNGLLYQAQTNGSTVASEPAWPASVGQTVADGGVTWVALRPHHLLTEYRLATSAAGLDAATPGASLSLGTEILGGVANAVALHYRAAAAGATDVVSDYTDVRLLITEVDQFAA